MRTGNVILDVIIQIVLIAIAAAIAVWVLGLVGAPAILTTVVWVLAAVAILLALLSLIRGRGGHGRRR
jgi:hypothetical protein